MDEMSYRSDMTLVQSITKDLHELPNSKLVEVARFVGELGPQVAERQRKALAQSFGCMSNEEGKAFEKAVLSKEGSEPAA
jgi:hypothetical protein